MLVACLGAGRASGLVIYRFGGEGLPAPPEAGEAGVEFVQLRWSDVDKGAGGELTDADVGGGVLRAVRHDPTVNIAPTVEENGGNYERPHVNSQVWDGDTSTTWVSTRYMCAEHAPGNYFVLCTDDFGTEGTAQVTLGKFYLIDRVQVVSGMRDAAKTVRSVRVHVAEKFGWTDITRHPAPLSPWVVEVRDNREQVLDIPLPARDNTGFIQVTVGEHNKDWEVSEIGIYAKGYVQKAVYASSIIEFDRPMAFGDLRWAGRQDPKAKVYIRTRSGLDENPVTHWRYTGRGGDKEPVSRVEYEGLRVGEKAGTSYDQDNWAFWSAPYAFGDSTGAPIVSPSPRRYLQLQAEIWPQDDDSAELEYVELRASEPLASNLVGEVWPVAAGVGQSTGFTYLLRPTIGAGDPGFDRLEIETSSVLGGVSGVRIGDESVPYEVVVQEAHRLLVSFPRLQAQDSGTLMAVDFTAKVLRYGTTFEVRVSDSTRPLDVPQGVNAGDATSEFEGNRVSVTTSVEEQELLEVRVEPPTLTPNGDGRNDAVRISYSIFEVTGQASVEVEVYDLAGRLVRSVYAGADGVGEYSRQWDGLDERLRLVPPGIYAYRVSADTDREKVQRVGLLNVAY
ncbi:MAG: FlgD immunoglobulin-like domain containing protein [Candidatus Latescibacterota bacterium]